MSNLCVFAGVVRGVPFWHVVRVVSVCCVFSVFCVYGL